MAGEGFDTDVLVVGAGPAGGSAALLLASYGIHTTVISKHGSTADTPRSHITNQRSLEVLRDMGVEEEVMALGTPQHLLAENIFCTSLAGDEIGRLRAWGTDDDLLSEYAKASPCTLIDLPQPLLEPLLLDNAARRGAKVRFGTELLDLAQDADGVTVRLLDRVRGDEFALRARYVVGADGGRSRVAEKVGLPFEGEEGKAGSMNIVFEADLSEYVAHRPGVLYWVLRPGGGVGGIGMGILRMVRPWHKWMAMWGYEIREAPPELDDEQARQIVRELIGDQKVDIRITSTSLWTVNQRFATEYSRGRVHCVGDAVHRHPPSNGLGSNTSIQDSYNLAWKLAMVLRGRAGAGLLDTYSEERAPVGRGVVARANQSAGEFVPFFNALGLGDGTESADLYQGIAALRVPDADGAVRRDAFARAVQLKHYEFNAHGVEMNHHYVSAAVIDDGNEAVGQERDGELYHLPTTRPGAKLPHAWLVNSKGRRLSTLDLVGGGVISLLTGLSGVIWTRTAELCSEELDVPIRVVRIGDTDARDAYGAWRKVSGDLDEAGCLLIRPDGYIAWRQLYPPTDESVAVKLLHEALMRVLCR